MPALPFLTVVLTITLAILWVMGEAINKPWLRRISGPLFVIVVVGIAVVATAVSTSFDDSIRYSGAMKRFVSALLATS